MAEGEKKMKSQTRSVLKTLGTMIINDRILRDEMSHHNLTFY